MRDKGQEMQAEPGLLLNGLDGANPLGFLAALGALRGLTIVLPEHRVTLSWVALDVWRPQLRIDAAAPTREEVLDGLDVFTHLRPGHEVLDIGRDLTIPQDTFRALAVEAADAASSQLAGRSGVDFLAAFGCEAVPEQKGLLRDTAWRTMSGAGHQHFIETMRKLADENDRESLDSCLFTPWARSGKKLSLRWDPEDDRRYAHRWRAPASDPADSEPGANRLAFEALPLFPVAPTGRSLATTGFQGSRSTDTFFTWPIWVASANLDVVRSLLSHSELQRDAPQHDQLIPVGVTAVFRSQRITVGKYRNFAPSRPV